MQKKAKGAVLDSKQKPFGAMSMRCQNMLKMIPRIVAERVVLKWSKWNPNINDHNIMDQLPVG